jgi:O-antigen chain-terminating methyltransferase
MNSTEPDVGIDELMRRIRGEVSRRARSSSNRDAVAHSVTAGALASPPGFDLPRWQPPSEPLEIRSRYVVQDFLAFDDEEFVRNAYAGILERGPDPTGLDNFLAALRSRRWNRIDVLGRLRYSKEGRARRVRIRGLPARFALNAVTRVPILGSVASFVQHLVLLPLLASRVETVEQTSVRARDRAMQQTNALADETERQGNALMNATLRLIDDVAKTTGSVVDQLGEKADVAVVTRLGSQVTEANDRLSEVSDRLTALARSLAGLEATVKADATSLAELMSKLRELDRSQHDDAGRRHDVVTALERELLDQRRSLVDQQRRLTSLLGQGSSGAQAAASRAPADARPGGYDHSLDAFYASFEDNFRGTREEIRERVSVYLDLVKSVEAGTRDAPIVDVACGRGEWLELLRDRGFTTRGVDLNRAMVAECHALGLHVDESDLLEFLKSMPDGSIGALTGFHVIEHLPFERVIELFDQTIRVLRRGGVAIFETPNPENLVVGSCNFYYDPTHRNPLPPEAMRFSMAARGFADVRIMRLRPVTLPDSGPDPILKILRDMLSAAPDYAILGFNA